MTHRSTKLIISLAYFFLLCLFSVELLKYSGVVANYLFFPFWAYVLIFAFLLLLWRFFSAAPSYTWLLFKFNRFILLPISFISTFIFYGLEAYTHHNYIFSTLHFNHLVFLDLFLLTFLTYIITSPKSNIVRFWPTYLLIGFLLTCWLIYIYNLPLFLKISYNPSGAYDDNFMEWLQVFILVLGTIIGLLLFFRTRNRIRLKLAYFLAALFFVFLAGEEISWGERLFNLPFEAPAQNQQNEFNLHNLEGVNEVAAFLYLGTFIYALTTWKLKSIATARFVTKKSKIWWQLFCFRGQEVIYFLPTFILNPYADRTLISGSPPILNLYHGWGLLPDFFQALHFLAEWRETFEVVFYLGLVLHLFQIYLDNVFNSSKA